MMTTIVNFYRSQCPVGYDPVCGPGGAPNPPKPPAPPSIDTAADAARKGLMVKKPKGFASTILAGGTLGSSSPKQGSSVLGGGY